MTSRHYAAVAALLLAACAKPETAEQTAARMAGEAAVARTALATQTARWVAHVASGHVDSVMTLYVENARVMAQGSPAAIGRDAIRAGMLQMNQLGIFHFTFTADSIFANGPLVLETGKWSYHLAKAPGAPPIDTTDSGTYMTRWARVGNEWLIADDMYVSEKPVVAAPPAPRRRS